MSIGLKGQRVVMVGCLTVCLGAGTVWANDGAEKLGYFESRRVVKQADQALASGRHDEALELYGRLITGLDSSDERQSEARYRSAMAALLKDPADLDLAREHLSALPRSFKGESGAEVEALRGLLKRIESVAVAEQEAKQALADQEKEAEAEIAAEATETKVVEEDLEKLKKQNARLRNELEQTRAELARKEEALAKLKAVVVGGGGG